MHALELHFDIWEIGTEYINAEHHHFSAPEKALIRTFVEDRWEADIVANDIHVCWVDYQPYRSAKEMRLAFQKTNQLLISILGNVKAGDDHPLTPELNLKHRAIHDRHHVILGAGFNAPGEICASAHMINLAREAGYSMFVQQYLFSDMIGATGHFYVCGGQYASQNKIVLFEPELIDELVELYMELGPTALMDYLAPIDQAARERHGWTTRSAH